MNVGVPRAQGASIMLPSRMSVPHVWRDVGAVLVSAAVALEIGAGVALKPTAALVPAAALGGILLLVDARARILFLVFGGLLTLQSSDSLGSLKLVYLAGVFASLGGALFRFSHSKDWFKRGLAMPLLRVSVALSTLILVSLLVARGHGVGLTDWLRDVAPYVLFASAPIFALDAQWAMSRRALVRLLVSAGIVATASFATHWLQQRNIAQLPFSRFALSSFYFPAALFAYATASALHKNHRRMRWVSLAVLVFALLIITGTRETLILAFAPIAVVVGSRRHLSARFGRLALGGPVALLLMAGAAYSIIAVTHASTTIISKRVAILEQTGTTSDVSYLDRQAATHAAASVFYANPILGAGPGTYFNFNFNLTATSADARSAFVLDSPMDFPAKFGIVGLAVIGFLVLSYASFLRSTFRFNHPRPETLALVAYAAVAVAGSALTTPLEDKGFTLGLVLLLALVFRTAAAPASASGRSQSPATTFA